MDLKLYTKCLPQLLKHCSDTFSTHLVTFKHSNTPVYKHIICTLPQSPLLRTCSLCAMVMCLLMCVFRKLFGR